MDKKVDTIEIEARDFYGDNCLVDQVNTFEPIPERKPQGHVHIYEQTKSGDRKLIHKSNLVVYVGREMLVQRAMNINNTSVTPTNDDFISWFGIGEGGVRPADPLDPTPPINNDTDLYSHLMINDSTSVSYGDYHLAGGSYPQTGFYKKIFDNVEYENDNLNDDKYLVVKITTTIDTEDANGKQLSEAGLFSSNSFNPSATNFNLFARVTYPSLIKTSERRLIFVWYLYF